MVQPDIIILGRQFIEKANTYQWGPVFTDLPTFCLTIFLKCVSHFGSEFHFKRLERQVTMWRESLTVRPGLVTRTERKDKEEK